MRVIDFLPHVIQALGDRTMTQTELTEAVWGTSGRNSATLVGLLDYMVARGLITLARRGRAKLYSRGPSIPQEIMDQVAKVEQDMKLLPEIGGAA